MSVPDSFIPGTGPNLVEASAGTGKTTWMVRTAVRLLLQSEGLPTVERPDRLLAVTFTRAATAELKERIRVALHYMQRVRDGETPPAHSEWMRQLLDAGGPAMSTRLDATLALIDRLAVTTIHGFCRGALEEFALECGVPIGLKFIEHDRQYRDESVADEWRALIWEPGPVSTFVLSERMSGDTARRARWSPNALEIAAKVVRQGMGAARPDRIDREAVLDDVRATLRPILAHWDEPRIRDFWGKLRWNKGGISAEQVDALCAAMTALKAERTPVVADIARWARSSVVAMTHKSDKTNKQLIPGEKFLDACELVQDAFKTASALLWQDAVLSVAQRMETAMHQDRVAGFDEMIGFLQRAVTDETNGARVRDVLASRYDAVLVDEFQDTDWAQWTIFSTTFGIKPLVLVGDPKQSIFGFRGADITAYRAAHAGATARGKDRVFSLDTNYRSDQQLVAATEILFAQSSEPFGVDKSVLDFEHVKAARTEPLLADRARRPMVLVDLEPANADLQERKVVHFIADEVARLLRDPNVLYRDKPESVPRRLVPSDIAVLVSANRQAVPIIDALRTLRISAVSGATGVIAESYMWVDVMLLVRAIEDPSNPQVVRRALSTSLGGRSAQQLSALEQNSTDWRRLIERLAEAQHDWTSFGVLTALMRLTNDWKARDSLAAYPDGERRLTDFRHVISLLQEAEREGHRNPTMLLSWASRFAAESDRDAEYRQQHLESDDEAVTVSSMHVAKGLEWPVVFCAYLWKARMDQQLTPHIARFTDGSRQIVFEDQVPGEIPGDTPLSEGLRLAYVALTRARSRTYVICAPGTKSPLHHLLDGKGATVLADKHSELITRLAEEDALNIPSFPEAPAHSSEKELHARTIVVPTSQTRSWTVSSYSRFTEGLKVSVDPTEVGPVDEAEAADDDALRADQLPGGAHTGNALHELFERFDFASLGEPIVVDAAIHDVLTRYGLPRVGAKAEERAAAVDLVRRMMTATLSTPLPGGTKALATVGTDRTLREWRFHLSMEHLSATRLAAVFKAHGQSWVAESYAPMLTRIARTEIDGFLTGVVDLVAQVDGRWWIIDWKSNALGPTVTSYDASACRQVMMSEHYVLQYHIYIVALQRFLRSRLGAAYDYDRDFGGVGYAFLRGLAMGAPSWFVDRPSRALVDALDACIGGYAL